MFRSASHKLLRQSLLITRPTVQQRLASTAPPRSKPRSWRNYTVRSAIAVAGVYYYNTSTLFADEPAHLEQATDSSSDHPPLPTLESLSPSARFTPPHPSSAPTLPSTPSSSSPPSLNPKSPSPATTSTSASDPSLSSSSSSALPPDPSSSPESLESEAHAQGAFNEETGEINWDCPCLGGMAHGPCGEEFRTAFSCFVFSKEEPKGMDCIENFKGMQNCFRQHPEIYGAELDEGEEEEGIDTEEVRGKEAGEGQSGSVEGAVAAAALPEDGPSVAAAVGEAVEAKAKNEAEKEEPVKRKAIYDSEDERGAARERSTGNPGIEQAEDELLPKAAHDARSANAGK